MISKKIVIIGGSGSIGSSIAKEVIDDGFEAHLIGRNEESLKSVSGDLNCEYSIADVNDSDQLKRSLQDCGENIYGLAYCVGSINLKPLSSVSEKDFIDSFKVNAIAAVLSIKFLKEVLKKNNGSILLFSTIAVKQGFINHSIISSSKGAIEGLTLSLAAELSPEIRVNCIAPSLTESKMSKKIISNDTIKKAIENMHPIPKIGSPTDFSKLSAFLLGQNNKWVTGQIIHVDGGRSTLRKKG
tara:strand:+ start:4 stop:729 length:726 start_codon:yes stop_codon:yes gene_type:complete